MDVIEEISACMKQGIPLYNSTYKGQSRLTPHNDRRINAYFVAGGTEFYIASNLCAEANPGKLVRSLSLRSSIRKGLTWNAEDKTSIEEMSKDLRRSSNKKYWVNDKGSRLLMVSRTGKKTRRVGAVDNTEDLLDIVSNQ